MKTLMTKKEQEIVNEFVVIIKKYKHLGLVRLAELTLKAFSL
jgi:hypothetical protein